MKVPAAFCFESNNKPEKKTYEINKNKNKKIPADFCITVSILLVLPRETKSTNF